MFKIILTLWNREARASIVWKPNCDAPNLIKNRHIWRSIAVANNQQAKLCDCPLRLNNFHFGLMKSPCSKYYFLLTPLELDAIINDHRLKWLFLHEVAGSIQLVRLHLALEGLVDTERCKHMPLQGIIARARSFLQESSEKCSLWNSTAESIVSFAVTLSDFWLTHNNNEIDLREAFWMFRLGAAHKW